MSLVHSRKNLSKMSMSNRPLAAPLGGTSNPRYIGLRTRTSRMSWSRIMVKVVCLATFLAVAQGMNPSPTTTPNVSDEKEQLSGGSTADRGGAPEVSENPRGAIPQQHSIPVHDMDRDTFLAQTDRQTRVFESYRSFCNDIHTLICRIEDKQSICSWLRSCFTRVECIYKEHDPEARNSISTKLKNLVTFKWFSFTGTEPAEPVEDKYKCMGCVHSCCRTTKCLAKAVYDFAIGNVLGPDIAGSSARYPASILIGYLGILLTLSATTEAIAIESFIPSISRTLAANWELSLAVFSLGAVLIGKCQVTEKHTAQNALLDRFIDVLGDEHIGTFFKSWIRLHKMRNGTNIFGLGTIFTLLNGMAGGIVALFPTAKKVKYFFSGGYINADAWHFKYGAIPYFGTLLLNLDLKARYYAALRNYHYSYVTTIHDTWSTFKNMYELRKTQPQNALHPDMIYALDMEVEEMDGIEKRITGNLVDHHARCIEQTCSTALMTTVWIFCVARSGGRYNLTRLPTDVEPNTPFDDIMSAIYDKPNQQLTLEEICGDDRIEKIGIVKQTKYCEESSFIMTSYEYTDNYGEDQIGNYKRNLATVEFGLRIQSDKGCDSFHDELDHAMLLQWRNGTGRPCTYSQLWNDFLRSSFGIFEYNGVLSILRVEMMEGALTTDLNDQDTLFKSFKSKLTGAIQELERCGWGDDYDEPVEEDWNDDKTWSDIKEYVNTKNELMLQSMEI